MPSAFRSMSVEQLRHRKATIDLDIARLERFKARIEARIEHLEANSETMIAYRFALSETPLFHSKEQPHEP
jgi:chaperonin cofactor prefoldin